jgi:coenzyme F420-reducing hydrogenase beta subunit
MQPDDEGFLYPEVTLDLCNHCGLCEQRCPFNDNYIHVNNWKSPEIYAVKHQDNATRLTSTSGGMFTAISDYVLSIGGVVYGACFDKDLNVVHVKAETHQQRDMMKGSKYVQSDLGEVFKDIKNELSLSRTVLFTGTPCQTAGLSSFLIGCKNDNLILCDLICHGVPSPRIWREYLSLMSKAFKRKILHVVFRSKERGWNSSIFKIIAEDKTYLMKYGVNDFISLYNNNYISRPSCHMCKFTNFHRPSDITIADYWGIEKSKPFFWDEYGISLVLVNSDKGKWLFENSKRDLICESSDLMSCVQSNLQRPTPVSLVRDVFWSDFNRFGMSYTLKKYANYRWYKRFKNQLVVPMLERLHVYHLLQKLKKCLF